VDDISISAPAGQNIPRRTSEPPFTKSSVGTALLLHFYEDDIVVPYHTYDEYFAGFDQHRTPLTSRHLAALHTYPSTVEDFLREHFPGPDLLPEVLPDNWDLYHL
jgi:hypothetical protein